MSTINDFHFWNKNILRKSLGKKCVSFFLIFVKFVYILNHFNNFRINHCGHPACLDFGLPGVCLVILNSTFKSEDANNIVKIVTTQARMAKKESSKKK